METLFQSKVTASTTRRCDSPVLFVAHPGHELRVWGWMETARPVVCVLTDGSGSGAEGRLESTARLLRRSNATAGRVFGRMSDREVYTALLEHDHGTFLGLADELAELLVAREADCVVGDAIEGYNPTHDLCRLILNAAVRMAGRGREALISNHDYLLVGAPGQCPDHLRASAWILELDEAVLARKLEAARSYPELASEVDAALARFGPDPFRIECLRPADAMERYGWDPEEVPFFERHGEDRVAAGVYRDVIRFREHLLPAADALWAHSERHA